MSLTLGDPLRGLPGCYNPLTRSFCLPRRKLSAPGQTEHRVRLGSASYPKTQVPPRMPMPRVSRELTRRWPRAAPQVRTSCRGQSGPRCQPDPRLLPPAAGSNYSTTPSTVITAAAPRHAPPGVAPQHAPAWPCVPAACLLTTELRLLEVYLLWLRPLGLSQQV